MQSQQIPATIIVTARSSSSRGEQEKDTKEITTAAATAEQNQKSCNMPVASGLKDGIRDQCRSLYTRAQLLIFMFYSTLFSLLFGERIQQEGNNNDHSNEDDTIERSLVSPAPTEKEQFVVGLYHNKDEIIIQTFSTKDEAAALYNDHTLSSRVIMKHDYDGKKMQHKLVQCCTASWDLQGLGVATLLYCDKDNNILDGSNQELEMIRLQIDQGLLPFVPPQRDQKVQKRLKATMRIAFNRKTVAYFGSAPLHYKSLSFFPSSSPPPAFATIRQKIRDNTTTTSAAATATTATEFKQQKYVALTLDDAPCRFSDTDSSEVPKIIALLKKYNVKATFMVVGSWCRNHEDDLIRLIQDGHELANHCMMDRSYEFDDPEDFGNAVDECSAIIRDLYERAGVADKSRCPSWAFRAPHGRYTQEMADQLASRGIVNVMCDTYASCPVVEDADFIGKHLTNTCKDGSIILLHMPEVHVRQWCLEALETLLEGLKHRNMQAVPLGEMAQIHSFRPEAGLASLFPSNTNGCLP